MPSKSTKRARRAGAKNKQHEPENTVKDDGKLYRVLDAATGRPIYLGVGVQLGEAERLARNLRVATILAPVD